MNDRRRDSVLVEAALDAARVTDDFVRGVLGLGVGQIGDDNQGKPRWQRWLNGRGQRAVVQGLGAQFAPEQLRKAANEADELVAAIDDLVGAWTAPALDAAGRLGAVGVRHIPDTLRGPDIGARSSELKEVHDRLSRVIGILSEARATVILAEMRAARDQV